MENLELEFQKDVLQRQIVEMIKLEFQRGTTAEIADIPIKDGQMLYDVELGISYTDYEDKRIKIAKAKTSELKNDSNFITNTVNNLVNYYNRANTYSKEEIDKLIVSKSNFNVLIVEVLPIEDISTSTIYLILKESPTAKDTYEEYMYINNKWESIGSTNIDLSQYLLKDGNGSDVTVELVTQTERLNLVSNETLSKMFSKVKKYFSDLKNVAFTGNYSDLTNKPSSLPPDGTAGGDLTGNYPNPTISVESIQNKVPTYTQSSTKVNLESGVDNFSNIFGKLQKWYADLVNLERYIPTYSVEINGYPDGITTISQNFKDLGMTMDKTVIELYGMVPANVLNIYTNSNSSPFNNSLPMSGGGLISIYKFGIRGCIEFIDYRTNKKYIKSNRDNVWSDWSEIVTTPMNQPIKTITYATVEPTTVGANEIVFVYE